MIKLPFWQSKPPVPLPSGLYRFPEMDQKYHLSLHLRVENEEQSSLIINGNYVLQLNATATLMAYFALSGISFSEAIKQLSKRFSISKSTLEQDYQSFSKKLMSILENGHLCYLEDTEVETLFPFQRQPTAPYRVDLALTYRCNNDCFHCYNEPERKLERMTLSQWKWVIDQLWNLGIPHIVFTGGEPTLIEDLIPLIEYAKQKGLIIGLNTNGRRLSQSGYAQSLRSAGLDHVQITLESADASIHDRIVQTHGAWKQTVAGISNALKTNLFVMTNTTLLRENVDTIPETLTLLSSLGVPTIGLNALIYSGRGRSVSQPLSESELFSILQVAQHFVDQSGQRLIWYTPTHYCHFDPMSLNLGVKGCTAALYNLCIEPNGNVLPCQSYYHPLGNILVDQWESIWNHPLATALRNRKFVTAECEECLLVAQCGGGCPLAPMEIPQFSLSRMDV